MSNQANANFGISVAGVGSVNGDLFGDIIVGAHLYDKGQTDEGAAFVHHGSAQGIPANVARILESNQTNARFGFSAAGAGDVNRDGFADVIVGAHLYDNGQTNEGRVFIHRGSSTGVAVAAAVTLESNQTDAFFGYSVATAGDVEGDGFADVLIGAMGYDIGQPDEGLAAVYSGSGLVTDANPLWFGRGHQAGARFGCSVLTSTRMA